MLGDFFRCFFPYAFWECFLGACSCFLGVFLEPFGNLGGTFGRLLPKFGLLIGFELVRLLGLLFGMLFGRFFESSGTLLRALETLLAILGGFGDSLQDVCLVVSFVGRFWEDLHGFRRVS